MRGRLAPLGLVPLAPRSDETGHIDAEVEDAAESEDGATPEPPRFAEADIFGDGPVYRGGDVGLAPFDKFARGDEVGRNGLFGQDMLAGGEGFLDDFRLDEDREAMGSQSVISTYENCKSRGGNGTHAMITALISSRANNASRSFPAPESSE